MLLSQGFELLQQPLSTRVASAFQAHHCDCTGTQDGRQCTFNVTLGAPSRTHCRSGKAKKHFDFSTAFHKWHDFRGKEK